MSKRRPRLVDAQRDEPGIDPPTFGPTWAAPPTASFDLPRPAAIGYLPGVDGHRDVRSTAT